MRQLPQLIVGRVPWLGLNLAGLPRLRHLTSPLCGQLHERHSSAQRRSWVRQVDPWRQGKSLPLEGLGIDGEIGASAVGTALDNDPWMKAFLHCFDVSDHANHPPLLLEAMERADGFIKSSLIE